MRDLNPGEKSLLDQVTELLRQPPSEARRQKLLDTLVPDGIPIKGTCYVCDPPHDINELCQEDQ